MKFFKNFADVFSSAKTKVHDLVDPIAFDFHCINRSFNFEGAS